MKQLIDAGPRAGLLAWGSGRSFAIGWLSPPILLVVIISLLSAIVVAWRADSLTYDSVVFIRYARQISEADWWTSETVPTENARDWFVQHSPVLEVIEQNSQHPGFAVMVAGVKYLLAGLLPSDSVLAWSLSAQIVSLLGLAVLVVAVHRLGTELVGPAAGLVGAALVGLTPPIIRIGADALSDAPATAMLVVSAVYFSRALRSGGFGSLVAGSIFAAMGYLIRPEAIQLALAMGLFLSLRLLWEIRGPRLRNVVQLAALVLPLTILVLPYTVVKGSALTKKAFLLGKQKPVKIDVASRAPLRDTPSSSPQAAVVQTPVVTPPTHMALLTPRAQPVVASNPSSAPAPVTKPVAPPRPPIAARYAHGLVLFVKLWSSLTGYFFALPILAALVSGSVQLVKRPDHLLIWSAGIANLLGLPFVLFAVCGYLDIRHVMPGFCLTAIWAWPGFLFLCHLTRNGLSSLRQSITGRAIIWPVSAEFASTVLIIAMLVPLTAVGAMQRLNQQIVGLRTMGEQLHEKLPRDTKVLDPSFVSSFYADLEKQNQWLYVGGFSLSSLGSTLDIMSDTEYLILSDRLIAEVLGRSSIPSTVGQWHFKEVIVMPLSGDVKCQERIRTYRIERVKATTLNNTSADQR